VYKYKGEFGVCSRNLELVRDENNGFWKIAAKYKLEERLPEGMAIQFEACGPKVQKNPMGLKEIDGFAFSAWNIEERKYLEFHDFSYFCEMLEMKSCRVLETGKIFDPFCIPSVGEGLYENGKQREGVVIRSQKNVASPEADHPISFKVINLNYEK
jgi:hypothetical protein